MRRALLTFYPLSLLAFAWLLFAGRTEAASGQSEVAAQTAPPAGRVAPETNANVPQTAQQFHLRVESNLVVVRAVVRDSQGRALGNLTKENFRLFDNGEEQKISQFSVDAGTLGIRVGSGGSAERSALPGVTAALAAPRNIAFYFDDLNMALDEINSARDAADSYLGKSLQPPDRAAIFTSSGKVHTDFTSDWKTLHDALIRVFPIVSPRQCPDISDYQAERIVDYEDGDAIGLGVSDLRVRCKACPDANSSTTGKAGETPDLCPPPVIEGLVGEVKQEALVVLTQARQRSRRSIGMLNAIVLGMAHMSGQKEIILTSPGFISGDLEDEVNGVIDRALTAQIAISSLDPKGVALLMPGSDVSSDIDPRLISLMNSFALSRELYSTAALAQIAEETGGDFFHHDNDLQAGFARLGEEPVSYMLAFAPSNLDGKFHKLQVKLIDVKGTLQARRGYFAIRQPQDEKVEAAPDEKGTDQAAADKDQLRRLVASREEFHDLALDVSTTVGPSSGESKQLAVLVKLDLNTVRFRKDADRNVNTLIFVAGVYDDAGNWVTGEQKRFNLKLPDAELQDMRSKGVAIRNTFQLKPGTYLLREVVEDSEDHHLGATNRSVEVR